MHDKTAAKFNEALAALQLGQPDRAERLLQALLRKTARHFDALIALGVLRGEQGRIADAAALFERAAKVRPDDADAHYNLGVALVHLGSKDRALDCYRNALHAAPRHLNACNNLAAELLALDRGSEALACVEQGLLHHPDDAQLLSKRGAALKDLGRIEEAIEIFRQVVRRQPGDPLGHANLGLALQDADRLDEAIASLERAVSLDPRGARHHSHLGLALSQRARLDDAVKSLRRAVELAPEDAELRENLGLVLLLKGDFEEGLTQYDFRHQLPRFKSQRPPIDAPTWRGEPLSSKSILVYSEQGLGDTIQFVRYVPLLARLGAAVTLAVQPKLIPLMSALSGVATIVASQEIPQSRFDYQSALMSLPRGFGTTIANIPTDVPYLRAAEPLTARWRERIGEHGFKIGISWQGNPSYRDDRHRSLPLYEFAPLAAIPGVRLISLQKGFGTEQIADVDFGARIEMLDGVDEAGAFVDTAAVMMALDLVISSDTAVPHLAGALARPVYVALGRIPDWRWLLDRDDCPWYPTARLFRQKSDGGWAEVFARMATEVRAKATPRAEAIKDAI
jgi:Flp pilus assembly protein TadD